MLSIILKDVGTENDKKEVIKAVKKAIGKDTAEKIGEDIRFTIEPYNTARMMIMIGERNDNDLSIELSLKDIDQLT